MSPRSVYLHPSQALSAPDLLNIDLESSRTVASTFALHGQEFHTSSDGPVASDSGSSNQLQVSNLSTRRNVYVYPEQAFARHSMMAASSVAGSSPVSHRPPTSVIHGEARQASLYGSSSGGTIKSNSSTTISLPPQQTPLSALEHKRVKTLSHLFLCPRLSIESGVEGLQEWVSYWSERGSRLRELVEEAQDVVQGFQTSDHPNSSILPHIMAHPLVKMVLPPDLHHYQPLLSAVDLWQIDKRVVVDSLTAAHLRLGGAPMMDESKDIVKPRRRSRKPSSNASRSMDWFAHNDKYAPSARTPKRSASGGVLHDHHFNESAESLNSAFNGIQEDSGQLNHCRSFPSRTSTTSITAAEYAKLPLTRPGDRIRDGIVSGSSPFPQTLATASSNTMQQNSGKWPTGLMRTGGKSGLGGSRRLKFWSRNKKQAPLLHSMAGSSTNPQSPAVMGMSLSEAKLSTTSLLSSLSGGGGESRGSKLRRMISGSTVSDKGSGITDDYGVNQVWEAIFDDSGLGSSKAGTSVTDSCYDVQPVRSVYTKSSSHTTGSGHDNHPDQSAVRNQPVYRESSDLHEAQVQEVILAYVAKRMTSWDLKKEISNHPLDANGDDGASIDVELGADSSQLDASGADVSLGSELEAGLKGLRNKRDRLAMLNKTEQEHAAAMSRRDKKRLMELEALNAKLARIEYELIFRCGRDFHPCIRSALHKVRFRMGYCSAIQLSKRLTTMLQSAPTDQAVEGLAHGKTNESPPLEDVHEVAVAKVVAWINLRWDSMDRWDLLHVVKQEVLAKVSQEHRFLVEKAMTLAQLPTTPFPPYRSSAVPHDGSGQPCTKSQDQGKRRPSLPTSLGRRDMSRSASAAKLPGSRNALPTTSSSSLSSSSSSSRTWSDVTVKSLLDDILGLPTVPNTRELVIEWLRVLRRSRCQDGAGWRISIQEEQTGAEYADEVLDVLELECQSRKQADLVALFQAIRITWNLPSKNAAPVNTTHHEPVVTPIISNRLLKPRRFIVHRPSPVIIPKATEERDSTLRRLSDAESQLPRTAPLTASNHFNVGVLPLRKVSLRDGSGTWSSDTRSRASDETHRTEFTPFIKHATSATLTTDSPHRGGNDVGSGGLVVNKVQHAAHHHHESPARLSLEIPRHRPDRRNSSRHRRSSKWSQASSEMCLDMASVFATRDSSSRASRYSILTGLEHDWEGGETRLSPLVEETFRAVNVEHTRAILTGAEPQRVLTAGASVEPTRMMESDARYAYPQPRYRDPVPIALGNHSNLTPEVTLLVDSTSSTSQQVSSDTSNHLPRTVADMETTSPVDPKMTADSTSLSKAAPLAMPSSPPAAAHSFSLLAMVLSLFDARLDSISAFSSGMLEIELLKMVEFQRQKTVSSGLEWNQTCVDRMSWLLDELKLAINQPQLDHVFARVHSSLASHSPAHVDLASSVSKKTSAASGHAESREATLSLMSSYLKSSSTAGGNPQGVARPALQTLHSFKSEGSTSTQRS